MKEILPVLIVCGVGIAFCVFLLVRILVLHVKRRRRGGECFELDDKTLTVIVDNRELH